MSGFENTGKWNKMIERAKPLYARNNDLRTEFERDYTRVIHSTAYRRMRHKTQVFFMPSNDHICTRIEHVTHVESISSTIAKALGLNMELTRAIATAHDIGHSPFGHQGERALSEISKRDIGETFWHEKNGVEIVDKIDLLEDDKRNLQNLNLTYAVRDGIISHCGEIDENHLKPREDAIDLKDYIYPNQYAPYTWEGCVVKISDKISYIGRDIEDAITLGILDEHSEELHDIIGGINNTILINDFIYDLIENSSPEKGLCFSEKTFEKMNQLKEFNYRYIYLSEKLTTPTKFFNLVINEIYETIKASYKNREKYEKMYPVLIKDFYTWYYQYTDEKSENSKNDTIFHIEDEKNFAKAIIYYISGMTDNYAIKTYESIIGF
ncbi:MAG: HD domain-containing protein [Clostridia bacterium]|nr:HD domain-containing protein [Clostridia bacterium]